jgi:hypothetical protein
MKLVAEPRFHRPAPRPVNLYFKAEELLGPFEGATEPPVAPPSPAAEELGSGTLPAGDPPPSIDPTPRNQAEMSASAGPPAATTVEATTAGGEPRTSAPPPRERGESARPGEAAGGGGRSAGGTGPRPRDQRRRGGKPRGPQSPRE